MDTNNCNKDNVGKDKIFTKNNTNSREMKDVCEIISFNIRKGMTSKYKFEQIKLNISTNRPKICFLQEVDIPFAIIDKASTELVINGYKIITSHITYNDKCCILAYVRNDIEYESLNIIQNYIPMIALKVSEQNKSHIYCSYYKPHAESYNKIISNFDLTYNLVTEFENLLAHNKTLPILLIGDTNVDWDRKNSKDKSQIEQIDNFIYTNGLKEIIKEPTHRTIRNDKVEFNQIDHCFTNIDNLFTKSIVSDISDHNMIIICKIGTKESHKMEYIKRRSFKSFNAYQFLSKLHVMMTLGMFVTKDNFNINCIFEKFMKSFNSLQDEFAPYKIIKCRKNRCKYMNYEILEKVKMKNKLFRNYLKTLKESPNNAIVAREKYIKARNEANVLLRDAKKLYYEGKFNEVQGPKDSWSIFNEFKGKFNRISSKLITISNDCIGMTLSNYIAKYFRDKILNIKIGITKFLSVKDPNYLTKLVMINKQNIDVFEIRPPTVNETRKAIMNLKSGCQGPDGISSNLLKIACTNHKFLELIRYIFSISIITNKVPDIWKISEIKALHKGNNKNPKLVSNYRPISSVSVLCKALEEIIANQITKNFEDHNIFTSNSFGYRNRHSTKLCIEAWHQTAQTFVKEKRACGSIFLDFKAGFDCLSPKILDEKLAIYKIGIHTRAWIRNFLTHRKHYITTGDEKSEMTVVNDGTDQGRKLSGLVFLIYTMEVTCMIDYIAKNIRLKSIGKTLIYVDDSITIIEAPNALMLKKRMEMFTNAFEEWANVNELAISNDKTELMIHSKHNVNEEFKICGSMIKPKRQLKALGVLVSRDFKWNSHCTLVNNEIKSSLYALKTLCSYTSSTTLVKNFAQALIISKIRYALSVWGAISPMPSFLVDSNFSIGHKEILKNIHTSLNHVGRLIVGYKGHYQLLHTNDLYKSANIFTFNQLVAEVTIMDFWSILKNNRPIYHASQLIIAKPNYNLRGDSKLLLKSNKISYNSFFQRGVHLWNLLPSELKLIENRKLFKVKLKDWIINNIQYKFE